MIGAGRDVRGGVSGVVNGYYDAGLDRACDLIYLPTMEDGTKLKKLFVAARARVRFESLVNWCDILHVHMSSDNSFYRKALFIRLAHSKKKKIVIHMHGSTFDLFYRERCNDRQKTQVRHIFAMADRVIALSEDWKRFLAEHICDAEKIEIVYNGVNLPAPYEKDYSNKKMLFLGILGQRKGTYDLLKVLPEVVRLHPDAHLYFGGDGERREAEALCRKYGIDRYVTFLGWVRGAEKEKYLRECSTYVLPTYHEGMPVSVLEAMAYGMAVVSTYTGGIPHMIDSGENGLLCQAGDGEALKTILADLLGNVEKKARLGAGARRRIESEFDVTRSVRRVLGIYEGLMGEDATS